jgi:hypothetical protein
MTQPYVSVPLHAYLWSIVFIAILAFPRWAIANGSDLPPEVVLQGFVKLEDGRAHLLVRLPLLLFSNFPLPKRGPGYLDLQNIDPKLKQIANATSHLVELSENGVTLAPTTRDVQLSLLSDRSFAGYPNALAHLQGPPLPASTDLFWNQGFFDVHFEYALQARPPNLWLRVNVPPEVGQRVKLQLEYLPDGETVRSYEISGDAGWIPLDPRWYEAAWLFAKAGFADAFALDRFVFLLCLIAPFRQFRGVLTLILVLAGLQALTLTAVAEGALANVEVGWLPLLSNAVLAAAMVLLAIANLAAPTLRRRWFLVALVGALGGFGLGRLFMNAAQFVGTHSLVAVVCFNIGLVVGEVVILAIAFYALRLLFARLLGPILGLIVLSAMVGHAGWHGMVDNGGELGRQLGHLPTASLWSALTAVALWLLPALLVGVVAYFLPKRFNGLAVPTLLGALPGRNTDGSPAGT